MEILTLALLGAAFVLAAFVLARDRSASGIRALAPEPAGGPRRFEPVLDPARARGRRINAVARHECEVVNEEGRAAALTSGDWDNRMLLHPSDWARLRSPLVMLAGLARANGELKPDAAEILESWIAWRLENAHWGGHYTEAKMNALRALCYRLQPTESDMADAAADCVATMSGKQKRVLVDHLDWMFAFSTGGSPAALDRLKTSLGPM